MVEMTRSLSTDIDNLVARLEAAEEGSAKLTTEIAKLAGTFKRYGTPHYTTSLDAALPGENIVRAQFYRTGHWLAEHEGVDGMRYPAKAATEALARRIACLRALASTESGAG